MKSSSNGSENGNGVPKWLREKHGTEPGEWYFTVKARPRCLMKTQLSTIAAQLQQCIELHTMPYQSELAVKMIKTTKGTALVPLTSGDLSEETGYSKQHVRRGLEEIEANGLGARRPLKPGGLTKGNVGIYSWVSPRAPKANQDSERANATISGLGQEFQQLASFFQKHKIKLDPAIIEHSRDSLLSLQEEVANLKNLEDAIIARAKGIGANGPIYKEERNGKEHESNGAGRQASTVVEEEPSLPACPPPVENQNGNATPGITAAEQILELPEVQQLQVETGDVISRKLAGDIAADLRDAPVEGFGKVLALRRKKGQFRAGLLRNLASGYANSNDIHKRSLQAKSDAVSRQMEEQTARTCRSLWESYSESERKQALRDFPEMPWPSG